MNEHANKTPVTFIPFKNGYDVTVYFILGKAETCVLLSLRRNISAQLHKGMVEKLACL